MAVDLTQYPHAMVEDINTGKAMPKVKVEGMDSNSLQPVDIQSRLASNIQTHNGAVVAPNNGSSYGNYASTWIDCDGFYEVAIKASSGSALNWEIQIFWSDDANNGHGIDSSGSNATNYKVFRVGVAARYMRVALLNRDATTPQTLNGSAYLKV